MQIGILLRMKLACSFAHAQKSFGSLLDNSIVRAISSIVLIVRSASPFDEDYSTAVNWGTIPKDFTCSFTVLNVSSRLSARKKNVKSGMSLCHTLG